MLFLINDLQDGLLKSVGIFDELRKKTAKLVVFNDRNYQKTKKVAENGSNAKNAVFVG